MNREGLTKPTSTISIIYQKRTTNIVMTVNFTIIQASQYPLKDIQEKKIMLSLNLQKIFTYQS